MAIEIAVNEQKEQQIKYSRVSRFMLLVWILQNE